MTLVPAFLIVAGSIADISMSETLLRPHSVETQISLPPISTATTKLRAVETQKEQRRQTQKLNSANKTNALKRKLASNGGEEDEQDEEEVQQAQADDARGKGKEQVPQAPRRKKGDPLPYGISVSKPNSEVRGHTSYLTFATLLPVGLRHGESAEGGAEGGDAEDDEFAGDDTMGAVLAGLTEEELEVMLGGAGGVAISAGAAGVGASATNSDS